MEFLPIGTHRKRQKTSRKQQEHKETVRPARKELCYDSVQFTHSTYSLPFNNFANIFFFLIVLIVSVTPSPTREPRDDQPQV